MKREDKAAAPRPKRIRKPAQSHGLNQATAKEFEREGMGVAPKE